MKIHLDLDCYFVSAERTRCPFLKNRCVAVAKGSDKKIFSNRKKDSVFLDKTGAFNSVLGFKNDFLHRPSVSGWKNEFIDKDGTIHGIVIAKSYETKPYGIKTGMPLKEALLRCPGLIVLPSDHLFYQELSGKLKSFLELKIPLLEQYSIDEFFGDLDGWIKDADTEAFIKNLKSEILQKFNLPITIGASQSKWIAKLITDKIKPFGAKALSQDNVDRFIEHITINDFPGIGKAISKKLASYGIKTLGEAKTKPQLFESYGKTGRDLYKRICGIDNEKVIPYSDRRSIGISRNFKAVSDRREIRRRTMILARYLSHTIQKLKLNPTTFYFKIRYEYGLKSAQSVTCDRFFNEKFLVDLAVEAISKLDNHLGYKIHYIAISASNFSTKPHPKTFSVLEYDKDKKYADLSAHMLKIRNKYGIDIIRYGSERL